MPEASSSNAKELKDVLAPGALTELRRLEFRTRRMMDADLCGQYRSAFRGTGLVYSDVREYQPGDDVKKIHWKISARTGKVYVKSYEEDRQLTVILVVDISRSTMFGTPRSKHDKAFEFAALVSMLAQYNGDTAGLCLFSDEVEEFLPPAKSRSRFQRLVLSLLQERELRPASNLAGALEHVLKHHRRRAVIFVVSDFLCDGYEESLLRLSLKHDVINVLIEHDLDRELPRAGLVRFQDAESGEFLTIDTSSPRVRGEIAAQHDARVAALSNCCRRLQCDLIRVSDNALRPLVQLMRRRTTRTLRSAVAT